MRGFSSCSFLWLSLFATADDAIAIRNGLSRIDLNDVKRHVSTLASDSLEGREAGTRGGKAAAAYLRSELKAIRGKVRLPVEQIQEFGREYQNLLVFMPGSDESLRDEVIVVGSHYDHVGYGNATNSKGPFGQIHNGADDNASGTAAILELIEAFSSLDVPPSRSLLFAFWDAEEAGLLGSKHWVANPTIPLHNLRMVLNIDMIGRLREGRVVTAGWRSAPGLRQLLSSNNASNELRLAFQPRVLPDSDHYPFYALRIPAIHLDTDKHEDYHRPSDDPEKLNWDGLLQITEFAFRVVLDAANRPDMPRFRNEAIRELPPSWLAPHAALPPPFRIGLSWDRDLAKKNVASVAQVVPDSPSSSAGIRPGDRIIQLGPWENGTFDDLKTVIQIVKNPVSIRVARPGVDEPIELSATLWGSPVRLGAGWIDDPALPNCVVLTHVVAESPADRAGMAAGDVIVELNHRGLRSAEEMRQRVMDEASPLQFQIERQGRLRDVKVELFDEPMHKTAANLPE